MQNGITKSVGNNGANERDDVKFVQSCLNGNSKLHKASIVPLNVDGLCRTKTIEAIKIFQKDYVGMRNPDGRVDPNGKTIRYLTMYLVKEPNTSRIKTFTPVATSVASVAGVKNITISYASGIGTDKRLVSNYSLEVIKIALKECNMNHAVITSTLRTPKDQARIMLENAKKNFQGQYNMYGRRGKEVLDVYKNNKTKGDDAIGDYMEEKISEIMEGGNSVSNHCFTPEMYQKRNVFDIGVNSTKAVCKNFNMEKFTSALKNLKDEGYIFDFIDETAKSNKCWHVEIKPFAKSLDSYGKNSMLLRTKTINGASI